MIPDSRPTQHNSNTTSADQLTTRRGRGENSGWNRRCSSHSPRLRSMITSKMMYVRSPNGWWNNECMILPSEMAQNARPMPHPGQSIPVAARNGQKMKPYIGVDGKMKLNTNNPATIRTMGRRLRANR